MNRSSPGGTREVTRASPLIASAQLAILHLSAHRAHGVGKRREALRLSEAARRAHCRNAERVVEMHGRGLATGKIAQALYIPLRRCAILIVPERDGNGWLALAGSHGWLFGSLAAARYDAKWLARIF